MIHLLLSFLLIFLSWAGLSSPICSWIERKNFRFSLFERALFGAAVSGAIANAVNFFVPISAAVCLAMTGLGILLLIPEVISNRDRVWRFLRQSPRILAVVVIIIEIVMLTAAQRLPNGVAYDTGLYHLQALRWFQTNTVPFGLANLHGRFGFNSFWLSIAALTFFPPLDLTGPFLVKSVLYAVFFANLLTNLPIRPGTKFEVNVSTVFSGLVLWFFALPGTGFLIPELGSLNTDLPAALFTVLCFDFSLRVQCDKEMNSERRWICLSWVCGMTAVLIKISQAPVMLLPMCITLIGALRRRPELKLPLAAWIFLVFVPVLWIARGLAISGCFLYPLAQSCMTGILPWAVPKSTALNEATWVRSWARLPGGHPEQVLGNWTWFEPWFRSFRRNDAIRVVIGVICFSTLLWIGKLLLRHRLKRLQGGGQPKRNSLTVFPLAVAVSAFGVLFWFIEAPATRFGYGFMASMAILLLSGAWVVEPWSRVGSRIFRPALLLVCALYFTVHIGVIPLSTAEMDFDFPQIPDAEGILQKTASGQSIWIPKNSDQCWNLPQPCAPYFDPKLVIKTYRARKEFLIRQ